DWWSAHVARHAVPHLAPLLAERPRMRALLDHTSASLFDLAGRVVSDPAVERYYRRLGHAFVARFACQHSYPADAAIGGATFGQYTAILALLIGWLHRERDRRAPDGDHTPTPRDERALIAALAAALAAASAAIGRALLAFT